MVHVYRVVIDCIFPCSPHPPPQQDYQTYVTRKAEKRQNLVASLSDYHQQELRDIETQREKLLSDYQEKKTGVCVCVCVCVYMSAVWVYIDSIIPISVDSGVCVP